MAFGLIPSDFVDSTGQFITLSFPFDARILSRDAMADSDGQATRWAALGAPLPSRRSLNRLVATGQIRIRSPGRSLFSLIVGLMCQYFFNHPTIPKLTHSPSWTHSDGTINYQARQHTLTFTLTPYYDPTDLSFSDAQSTLQLTYVDTLLYTEREDKNTTGLDALGVRPAGSGETGGEGEDPVLPIASEVDDRLSLDCEGLVLEGDGT